LNVNYTTVAREPGQPRHRDQEPESVEDTAEVELPRAPTKRRVTANVAEHRKDPHARNCAVQVIVRGCHGDKDAALRECPSQTSAVVGDAAAPALLDDQHASEVQIVV
jgi:hypothetical protein